MSETRSTAETIYPNQGGASTPAELAPAPETAAPAEGAPQDTAAPETQPTLLTEKPDEAKPEEAPAPPEPPFEADKITFPEGVKPDPEIFGKFSEKAKSHGLTQKAAQDFIDLHHEIASAQANQSQDAWKTVREGWVAATKADPEIGGANLSGVVTRIAKVVLDNPEFGHPQLRESLEMNGSGDHLPLIWTLNRLAKALEEGTHVGGDAPSRRAPRSLAEVMYPNLSAER